MSDYKQYRADLAKAFWGDDKLGGTPKEMAARAVSCADALIAELERTEAQPCDDKCCDLPLGHYGQHQSTKNGIRMTWGKGCSEPIESFRGILKPEPPAPELPRLNTGWKWAEEGHIVTKWDQWWIESEGRFEPETEMNFWTGQKRTATHFPLATPDWHNPENIADPGEGYRFLVQGENNADGDQCKDIWGTWFKTSADKPVCGLFYRTPATRPLPPVLADEKEVQP